MAKAGGIRMGGVYVEIGANAAPFFAAVGAVDKRLQKLGSFGVGAGVAGLSGMFKAFDGISKSIAKAGHAVSGFGTKLSVAGVAMAAPAALAMKQFASFDDAIRATAAVTGSLGAEGSAAFQMLNDKARDLGATTSFTAVEVAKLMTELGRAGFKPDEIDAMTGAVLDLSRATGTNATQAAVITAAALRQFALGAGDATRVADSLTQTANATNTSVEGLGESLKYAGPVAASLGMSLEDTLAMLGSLGNVGIQGSEAGTAIRRLSVIAAGAGEKLQELFGVSNTDAAGNLKPLVTILDEINDATMNMPVAERTAKMAKAFGLLGITSANVLSRSAGGVRKLVDELHSADGVTARTAKAMDAGLGGSMRIALSAIEGTQLALGDALAPTMQTVIGFIEDLATSVTGFVKENQSLVVSVAKGTVAVIGAGLAFYALGTAIAVAGGLVGALLSPLGLLAAGIAGLVVQTPELSDKVTSVFGEVQSTVSTTMTGVYDAITGGDLGGAIDIAMTGLKSAFLAVAGDLLVEASNWAANFQNVFDDLGASLFVGGNWLWTKFEQAMIAGNLGGEDLTLEDKRQLIDKRQTKLDQDTVAAEADVKKRTGARTQAASQFGVDMKAAGVDAKNRLASLTSTARDRRILSSQADDVIAAVQDAKSLEDLRSLAQEFFSLRDTGMLSDSQQKKYGEAVDMASDRLEVTSTAVVPGGGTTGVVDPDKIQKQLAESAAAAAASGGAGTFSSLNLGGALGVSGVQERIARACERTAKNTEDIGDEGAVGP